MPAQDVFLSGNMWTILATREKARLEDKEADEESDTFDMVHSNALLIGYIRSLEGKPAACRGALLE